MRVPCLHGSNRAMAWKPIKALHVRRLPERSTDFRPDPDRLLIVRLGYLKPAVGEALGDFVFARGAGAALPYHRRGGFQEGSPWPLWVAYFSGVA